MRRLSSITVQGYKSIKDQTLELGRLNVLIGGNGVGKSNLIGVFKLLRDIYDGNLQTTVAKAGGANALLHFGRKSTSRLRLQTAFAEEGNSQRNAYRVCLDPTDTDGFVFAAESVGFHESASYPEPYWDALGIGHSEALLRTNKKSLIAGWVRDDMASYRVYHFEDTSDGALVKQTGDAGDNRFLHVDARNLAAFLFWMKAKHPDHLKVIEATIRIVAPFFDRFQLEPLRLNEDKIRLEWRERGSESYFNAQQLSDGTLRFMCLATLLLQPELPRMVLLDEPELGLHPAAIHLLAALLKQASERTQLLVSTQSVTLVNQLSPEDVWVADRVDGATVFKSLGKQDLSEWIGEYALGELWEKNVLGGRP
jgi:predicted ATPase